jgi:hypothetical protein
VNRISFALLVTLIAPIALSTAACASDEVEALKNENGTEETPVTRAPKKTEPAKTETPKATTPAATPPTTPTSCSATKTATECQTCCAKKLDPRDALKACICKTGSSCQDACKSNLCTDDMPDFGCSLCAIGAGCKLIGPDDVSECMKTSACDAKAD